MENFNINNKKQKFLGKKNIIKTKNDIFFFLCVSLLFNLFNEIKQFLGNEYTAFGTAIHSTCESLVTTGLEDPNEFFQKQFLEEIKNLESERIDIPQGEFELPSNYRKRTGKFHQERINEISDLKSKLFSDELLTSFLKNSFLKFMDEHQLKINKLMEIPRCHYKVGKYNINKEYLDISLMVEHPLLLVRNRRPPRGQHSDYFDKMKKLPFLIITSITKKRSY